MTMNLTKATLALAASLLGAASCGEPGCTVSKGGRAVRQSGHGSGAIEVRGRLVDAETGKAVARTQIWVHGFNDEADYEVSLERDEDATSFVLRLPERKVRLRVYDGEHVYALFEKNFMAPASGPLDVEVRLEPTHWIVLHGRVLNRDGDVLTPVRREESADLRPRMGGDPIIGIGPAGSVYYDDDGNYTVRVPRELLEITTLDTNRVANPRQLDLRGVKEDERAWDVILEVWHPEPAGK
jgi:hypothetical protein